MANNHPSPGEIFEANERAAARLAYAAVEAGWRESQLRAGLLTDVPDEYGSTQEITDDDTE
jgi:hypothetical protein